MIMIRFASRATSGQRFSRLKLMSKIFCVYLLLISTVPAVESVAQGWYTYRLLANAGLQPAFTSASETDCVNQCAANSSCSAVSYSRGLKLCVLSLCANLQLQRNPGWHSYILIPVMVETVDYKAPPVEWMMTDSCGSSATGVSTGIPPMVLSKTVYKSSPSPYFGNTFSMNGSNYAQSNYGSTGAITNAIDYITTGMTIGFWIYYDATPGDHYVFGISFGTGALANAANVFFYYNGLSYNFADTPAASPNFQTWSYSAPVKTWIHYGFVYNPKFASIQFYINGTIRALYQLSKAFTGYYTTWTVYNLGGTPTDNRIANGRVYCVRIHNNVLNELEIWASAQSCLTGRVRFQ